MSEKNCLICQSGIEPIKSYNIPLKDKSGTIYGVLELKEGTENFEKVMKMTGGKIPSELITDKIISNGESTES